MKNKMSIIFAIVVLLGGVYFYSQMPSDPTVEASQADDDIELSDSPSPQPILESSNDNGEVTQNQQSDLSKVGEAVDKAPAPRQKAANLKPVSESRPFKQAEDFPGYNLEVMEEKKVEFLVNRLGLFEGDAVKVSERYQDILKAVDEARESSGDEAMMRTLTHMSSEYDIWLRNKLGDKDFQKYNEFVTQTFAEWQTIRKGEGR